MFTAEEINRRSADEEVVTRPQQVHMAYVGEVAVALQPPVDVKGNARQALQESLDLREQGHADN